ncbi:hypothetical protein CLV63_1244 [Murinocardiopsis flavida]|uniref:CDP-glycerol:poly(Glycerophosphate) glycerophosphotransferase n=1 Tax=Murinocardiopsis flavida TaxID=645275 RepID=A0A2P8CY46_9ACTN|nr:hypothetical protein [Murinocardiopsis flavida]PSK89900.1 hypothetical protein CLV63_1244 [Murinocardiopsis flavida]
MDQWLHTPVGLNAQRWVTRPGCRTVLVMVHSVACAQRLMDVVALLKADGRIQIVFTMAPSIFHRGVPEWLAALDCVVIPWSQAEQTRFDLAIAASYWGIERIHAPLVLLPHGAGFGKFMTPALTGVAAAPRGTFGLDRQRLLHDGRVIPSALVLAHEQERRRLAEGCPEALQHAQVVGDPVVDRLLDARMVPQRFRAALGVGSDQRLAVMVSTWGPHSLLGARSDAVARLVEEAREQHGWRVALLVHPNVWASHGTWQMRAWMADWESCGLIVLPQRTDCVGVLAAADVVIGDHGSTTLYATLLDRPLAMAGAQEADVDPHAPISELLLRAPTIAESGPVLAGVEGMTARFRPGTWGSVAAQISSHPGLFATRMRRVLYEQVGLAEPQWQAHLPHAEIAGLRTARGGEGSG